MTTPSMTSPWIRETVPETVRGTGESTNRAALYVLAAAIATGAPPEDFPDLMGDQPACLEIAKHLDLEAPISNTAWREWIGQRPAVRDWLGNIQPSEGVHSALRFVLWVLTGKGDLDLVSIADLQASDLAEG